MAFQAKYTTEMVDFIASLCGKLTVDGIARRFSEKYFPVSKKAILHVIYKYRLEGEPIKTDRPWADARLKTKIQCLSCGRWFRQINDLHLRLHDMTTEEYKEKFGFARGSALVCGSYSGQLSTIARKSGKGIYLKINRPRVAVGGYGKRRLESIERLAPLNRAKAERAKRLLYRSEIDKGTILKLLRMGLSKKDVADALGASYNTVQRRLTGRR